nr:protein MIZU-KUSSEI 1 [Ipomoea trifida]
MAFPFKNQNLKQTIPIPYTSPFHHMENPHLLSLLQRTTNSNNNNIIHTHHHSNRNSDERNSNNPAGRKRKPSGGGAGGLLRMFKLLPMLTTGCKMVALLGKQRPPAMLTDSASTTGTLFGYRKGRVSLAIQEDPHRPPVFMIELPMLTAVFHKEMANDVVRLALESETKTHKKKLLEEFVWAVYCNGRKMGYSIRRKNMTDDETHVMQHLRGVSMGAGVLPGPSSEKDTADGEMTYMRARFDRRVGSKDSEALYMINPDGASAQELSIFFVRVR